MKNSWVNPPNYYGGRSNKRVLKTFSAMLRGLSVVMKDKHCSDRLQTILHRIEFQLDSANGPDIGFFVNAVFEDIVNIRDVEVDGTKSELASAMRLLEEDVERMLACIKEGVIITPWSDEIDKRIVKFTAKIAALKTIYKRTVSDYERVKNVHTAVMRELSGPTDERARRRLEAKAHRSYTYLSMRATAAEVLDEILEELTQLEETAKSSPSLAGKINRIINVKKIGDFYGKPIRSQRHREKVKNELYYIIKNVENGKTFSARWSTVLYQRATAPDEKKTESGILATKPSATVGADAVKMNENKNLGGI